MTYNISFDISGVLILTVVCFILQKNYVMNDKTNRLFRRFVVTTLGSGILDIITAYTISYAAKVPIPLNVILNTAYMWFANFASFAGVQYILSNVELQKKFHSRFNGIVIGLYAGLLFVNLFTGVVFSFKNHVYNKGPLFYSTYVIPLILILHLSSVMIFKHKLFSKKQLLFFSSFILSPIVFIAIQMVLPSYLLTFFATSLSALLMLFILETPDFVELEYLRKNLEKEVHDRTSELKKANAELEKKNRQAKQDMELAAHLQKVLYPHAFNYMGWDIAIKFEPHSGISGDLYDFYVLEGKLRGFGLFDVSGHGISSGLVTVLAKNTIFREFRNTLPLNLSDAMKRISNSIIRVKGDIENYLTGVICRIDRDDSSKIEMTNAGAPYPIYKAKNKKKATLLTPDKRKPQYGMLGVEGLDVSFQTINFTMHIGDLIVLYTDGITEAENEAGEQYGVARLQNVIEKTKGTAQEIINAITEDFNSFTGEAEIEDDISIIAIKRIDDEDNLAELELIDDVEDVDDIEDIDDDDED